MRLILFLLFGFTNIIAQNTYFNKNYDVLNGNQTMKSLIGLENSYYILGTNRTVSNENKYTIWQIDELGEVQNLYNYGEINHNYLEGRIIFSDKKLFVFLSQAHSLSDSRYYLASLSQEGELLWERTYDMGILDEGSRKFTSTNDGGFILTGFSANFPDELGQAYIIKTDSVGNIEWQKDYGKLDRHDQGNEIIQTEDGGYLVMGWTSKEVTNRNVWVFKIDSLGNMLWEETYSDFRFAECTDILEVADGYVLAGYQYPVGELIKVDPNGYILKIDKEGNLLWEKIYGGTLQPYGHQLDDVFREVRELEDGSLAVIGHSRNHNEFGQRAGILMKLTAEGDSLWTKAYYNNFSSHYLWDFQVTEDNGFVMCGFVGDGVESGTQDGWVLKVDSLGNTCQLRQHIHYLDSLRHHHTLSYPILSQSRPQSSCFSVSIAERKRGGFGGV